MFLFLLAAILSGDPPRLPQKPWHLTAVIEAETRITILSHSYASEEECQETALLIAFSEPVEGRLVSLSCDRDPFTI